MVRAQATRARLAEIPLPDFGRPAVEPLLPPAIFAERLARLRAAMAARGYDHLVVWADREHSANLAYLSGFDPRFEEAVLVVGASGDPAVLVGNECAGMAAAAPLPMRTVTFQDLSLPGQPRDDSRIAALDPARRGDPGGQPGRGRGLEDVRHPGHDRGAGLPRRRAPRQRSRAGLVENAIRPPDRPGRRAAGDQRGRTSSPPSSGPPARPPTGCAASLTGLRPGMTERECARLLAWNGTPLSCHLMLTAGPRAQARACSARAIGRSSGATRSRSPTASGAR